MRDIDRSSHAWLVLEAGVENDFPVRAEKAADTGYGPYIDGFPQDQHKYGPFDAIRDRLKALKNDDAGENTTPPAR